MAWSIMVNTFLFFFTHSLDCYFENSMRRVCVSSLCRNSALLCGAGRAAAKPHVLMCATRLQSNGNVGSPVGGDVVRDADTHPDFQPRIVSSSTVESSIDEIESIKKDIRETIRDEEVVLFMKGLPEAPVCSFSKKLVDVLEALGLEYTSFDVLAHPVVRTYVKELSDWPTIPQLWVKGEFLGGIDICLKMAESGDLQATLDKHGIKHRDKI